MFHKNNQSGVAKANRGLANKKETIPSIITKDIDILGNIVSDGNVDFDGNLNGNIRCATLTIRANGTVKGEVIGNHVMVYGTVKGLIRAKHVQFFAGANVEGIIMHETIVIEDGAMVDGKFKRTDKIQPAEEESEDSDSSFAFDEEPAASAEIKVLENIRLIR